MEMDVEYEVHEQLFEWNFDKAVANLAKHRISFEIACEVFFDPFIVLVDAMDSDEARDAAIGYTGDGSLLFVVHLVRSAAIIRIISARPATSQERKIYEDD